LTLTPSSAPSPAVSVGRAGIAPGFQSTLAIDSADFLCSSFAIARWMGRMRNNLTMLAASGTLLVALNGGAEAGKTCLATATDALPKITGLVVKRSRTRAVSPAILASWKGQSKPIIVEVDVETEGEAQTYSYMCVVTQGSAFVQRTMN
jgi:hypothetical protein